MLYNNIAIYADDGVSIGLDLNNEGKLSASGYVKCTQGVGETIVYATDPIIEVTTNIEGDSANISEIYANTIGSSSKKINTIYATAIGSSESRVNNIYAATISSTSCNANNFTFNTTSGSVGTNSRPAVTVYAQNVTSPNKILVVSGGVPLNIDTQVAQLKLGNNGAGRALDASLYGATPDGTGTNPRAYSEWLYSGDSFHGTVYRNHKATGLDSTLDKDTNFASETLFSGAKIQPYGQEPIYVSGKVNIQSIYDSGSGGIELVDKNISGNAVSKINISNSGITINADANNTGSNYLVLSNLPTSDPGVEGALWDDNGVLKISHPAP